MTEKDPLIQPPPYGPPPPQNPGYLYPPQPVPAPAPQVVNILPTSFGESSVACVCPNCHKHVTTEVNFVVGTLTILISLIIFLLICWPCFWIPCVIDSLKDVEHRCPNCKWLIGKHKRL
ncbi:Lipopolysaccharide-induced tumor necrosis factor-alpha factor-like [Oopsacas minuta]|uniref:Lipopolysaccharide-induced tumor necrosis factor-alpha factor-like n=1 Tax=Oopsacas minuta TaxID=111878 RepID=A0AAV7JVD2_9METZ|nr:Lipopolysaccharide-induced tumor necrosis factor-alpha factor-like [Oopsacas minuta]